MADPWTPPDNWKVVKLFRFINVLDDAKNVLSPVKLNVWAANVGAASAMAASIFSWIAGHMAGMEILMGSAIGWLTQAHTTHHYDKKERNRANAVLNGKDDPDK